MLISHICIDSYGSEWAGEFSALRDIYGITHQHTSPSHLNGMAERLIKMIKHGLTMIAAVDGHEENWDVQLWRVLFGDRCGV